MDLPERGWTSSQPIDLALAISCWHLRVLSPVRLLIAASERYDRVPSERALQAIVTSTKRIVGGSEDWWMRRMYSDLGTAGRGSERAPGSILAMVDSDLSPPVPLAW